MESAFYPVEDIKLIQSGQTVFSGALMIADISGFTEITETLSHGGKEGVEELTSLLNQCFHKMLEKSVSRGGSVITFSGDSILVRFTDPEEASLCAREILDDINNLRRTVVLGRRFSIRAKAVVGKGSWNQFIIGGMERAHILVSGGLVRELAEREQNASPGELIFFENKSAPSGEPYTPPETDSASFLSSGSKRLFGEYRPVAAVFISVVPLEGDEEDVGEFQKLYRSVQSTVEKHGGHLHHIDDLVPKGSRIMALFGAPVSEGRDTLNSVLAALETMNSRQNHPAFILSCGIDAGYAFSGMIGNEERKQYTVIGDSVNTAARLAGVAAPGTVTVSSRVASKTTGEIRFGKALEVSLKGKEGMIEALQALGTASGALSEPFIGREREILEVKTMLGEAAGPVLLSGSAGVGKTALLRVLEKELTESDFRVVRGSAGIRESGSGILSSLLENICGTEGSLSGNLDVLLEEINNPQLSRRKIFLANMLLRLSLPDTDFDRLPPKLRSENLLDAVIILLSSLGKRTCVFLEDIHQSSREELEFIFKVISGVLERSETAFLLSVRPEGEKNIPEEPLSRKYTLEGLSSDESSLLLSEYSEGMMIDEEVADILKEKARGNPFFLVQFLLYMKEKNLITSKNGRWEKSGEESLSELPESVFSMIMARIDTLGERTRESLKVASVVGMRFSEQVLSRVVRRNVHFEMSESIRAGLTFINSYIELEHIFSHMLIRDVAYDSILTDRKKQLHREIGDILEENSSEDGRESGFLALHFLRGELWEKAADYSMKAGKLAADEFRNLEALEHYRTAAGVLEKHLPEEKNKLAECFYRSGTIEDRIGSYETAAACFRRSVGCSRDSKLTQLSLMGIADILFNQGNMDQGLELTEEVERIIEQSPGDYPETKLQIAAYRAWTHCIKGNVQSGEREALKAVELGESLTELPEVDRARKLGHALNTLATVHWAKSEFSTARELYERAIELALNNGLKREAAVTWGNIGLTLEKQGRYEEAVDGMNKQLRMATEIGEKFLILSAHGDLGMTYSVIGDFEKALFHAARQREMAESMKVAHDLLLAVNHLATINITLGHLEEAEEYVDRAFAILEETDIERERSHTLYSAGKLAAERQQNGRALELMKDALELADKVQSHSLQHLILLETAEIYIKEGCFTEAGTAIDSSLEVASKTGLKTEGAHSRLARAKLLQAEGSTIEAENLYREAIQMFEKVGTRYPLARALNSLAYLLGAGNAEGRELESRALELFKLMKVPPTK